MRMTDFTKQCITIVWSITNQVVNKLKRNILETGSVYTPTVDNSPSSNTILLRSKACFTQDIMLTKGQATLDQLKLKISYHENESVLLWP